MTAFPATLEIDYPDRELNRLTTALRIFTVIPIAVVLGLVSGSTAHGEGHDGKWVVVGSGGVLFGATVLMLVFRRKYPRWWFDWNLALTRFSTRVGAYAALLRDEYPSTDDEQAVHIGIPYPDAVRDLDRWQPLYKWFLAIPHYLVLACLGVPRRGGVRLCRDRVVRDSVHRALSARPVRLRGRGVPVVAPGVRLCVPAHHRSLSSVQPRRVGGRPLPDYRDAGPDAATSRAVT